MFKPTIQTPIMTGAAQIEGSFDFKGAQAMARRPVDGTSKLTIEIVSDDGSGK
jgi:hypothetical protein